MMNSDLERILLVLAAPFLGPRDSGLRTPQSAKSLRKARSAVWSLDLYWAHNVSGSPVRNLWGIGEEDVRY